MKTIMGAFFCLLGLALVFPATAPAASLRAAHDFDGDGLHDIAVYHRDLATFYVRRSTTGTQLLQPYGWSETIPVSGDFDGDSIADFAVYHRKSGTWYIQQSGSGTRRVKQFGYPGTQPVPGDYNGDGMTDLALFDRAAGAWFFLLSPAETFSTFQWGWKDTQACPADYDGDGDTDAAVYYGDGGDFYIRNDDATQRFVNFGWNQVQPKTGDFNGDGTDDICLYDPTLGDWYFLLSPADTFMKERYGFNEGNAVPGYFDADAITDKAIYHPETGRWFIWRSLTDDQVVLFWGWSDARAVKSWAHGVPEDIRVLCFGDGVTFGRGSSGNNPSTGYPIRLERRLRGYFGGDWTVKNEGLTDESASSGRVRIPRELVQNDPDITIIVEGAVDMEDDGTVLEEGEERDDTALFEQVRANLFSMCLNSRTLADKTIIATIPPVLSTTTVDRELQQARIEAFIPELVALALSSGATVAPVFEAITRNGNWELFFMNRASGLYPNDAGYDLMADLFFDIIVDDLLTGQVY